MLSLTESCGGQERLCMILYLTGNECDLTKSGKGGWVNGPALCPPTTALARYSMMTSGWSKTDFQLSETMLILSPWKPMLHCIWCLGAAWYTMLGLDDLVGTYGNYWHVVVTSPPRLHWEAGCSCLQLWQTCVHLQWGNVHLSSWKLLQPSLPLWNHLSVCMSEVALDEPDLDVCLAHMPFFIISAISSKAAWGKGYLSTKWLNPHIWNICRLRSWPQLHQE